MLINTLSTRTHNRNRNLHSTAAAVTYAMHVITKGTTREVVSKKVGLISLLLYEPYANESSQISPFLAVRPQFESVHYQNRRLSSHSYSHESVIFFVFLGLIFFKLRRGFFFEFNCTRLRAAVDNGAPLLSPLHYDRGQQVAYSGWPHAEPIYLIGDAASRCGLSPVGYFIPLNGRRPLNGHPPSLSL